MKCVEFGEETELLAYSARKLNAERAAAVERHLENCTSCREFVAGQRAVWEALEGWEMPEVSAGFDQRLYERIERDGAPWWRRAARRLHPRYALPAAAAACLLIVAGLVLEQPRPAAPAPAAAAQAAPMQAEQLEHAADDVQMLTEFSRAVRPSADEL